MVRRQKWWGLFLKHIQPVVCELARADLVRLLELVLVQFIKENG